MNLSVMEQTELAQHEATIERGLGTFVEVGQALLAIRDGRLYRLEHGTFEDYCRERWSMSRPRAYQLIEAADVAHRLSTMVDKATPTTFSNGLGTFTYTPASERQVRPLTTLPADQQPAAWQRAVETLPEGERMTAAHVSRVVRSMTEGEADTFAGQDDFYNEPVRDLFDDVQPQAAPPAALVSSESKEWYTPAAYIEAAREVMGAIDLDPASCETANRVVNAAVYFTAEDDGMAAEWHGRVWLNPPYGREEGETDSNQARWSRRLIAEYMAGRVTEAVLLVNATPSNKWWAPLWDFPICFTDHRIRFYSADGVMSGPTHSNALVYLGPNVDAFDRVFTRLGVVAVRRSLWIRRDA